MEVRETLDSVDEAPLATFFFCLMVVIPRQVLAILIGETHAPRAGSASRILEYYADDEAVTACNGGEDGWRTRGWCREDTLGALNPPPLGALYHGTPPRVARTRVPEASLSALLKQLSRL